MEKQNREKNTIVEGESNRRKKKKKIRSKRERKRVKEKRRKIENPETIVASVMREFLCL